jgi:hypothetical protein
MQIQDSQSMFQHIENGGSLALDMRGNLATESAVGRFFQKIGDAIGSLTAAGRAAIETRNAVPHLVMANIPRRDPVINPTLGEIPYPATPTRRNALAMRLAVEQALTWFSPEARAAARNPALELLRFPGVLEPGSPAEIRGMTLGLMSRIHGDKEMRDILRSDYTCAHAQLDPMLRAISDEIRNGGFQSQAHYIKDAKRRNVRDLNGKEAIKAEFKALFPDPKFSGFISMMISQSGMQFSLSDQLEMPDKIKDHPNLSDIEKMTEKGFATHVPRHPVDVRVDNSNKAHITLEMERMIQVVSPVVTSSLRLGNARTPTDKGPLIDGERYTVEMVIDFDQNMEGKDIPDFTWGKASRAPSMSRRLSPSSRRAERRASRGRNRSTHLT